MSGLRVSWINKFILTSFMTIQFGIPGCISGHRVHNTMILPHRSHNTLTHSPRVRSPFPPYPGFLALSPSSIKC